MSEIMRPIPFPDLVKCIRCEFKTNGSVFCIRQEKFYKPVNGHSIELFGTKINSPVGPAAGPNSQLAQNILAAYLAGSRFIELKTVQIMDGEELRKAVARPCINVTDEGYNVEWSTELTVEEALGEYVKAWFLCHVFGKEFGLPENVIFNMSVGYSLDGIKSKKIDAYIEGMKNASSTEIWKSCYQYILDTIGSFEKFNKKDLEALSPAVSPGITLSTLHGCPREEIEKIAAYLLTEKGLHTYVKCNPTLLDYETARKILDEMGYGYISFDDHHFKDDLQFDDAVDMLKRLRFLAKEKNLSFGVKLTNTFPVDIKQHELPGNEMYMSGRSLFPLSIRVAKKLSETFSGELPVSYSGGADFFNLAEILETGIRPVTVATTILKPGGYERLTQLAELAEKTLGGIAGPGSASGETGSNTAINVKVLNELDEKVLNQSRYHKEYRQAGLRKTSSPLPLFDCAKAPCQDGGCPIHQRIPEYLAQVADARYAEAFKIIAVDNTAPSITGTICDHQCQNKCTRLDYEDPLEIRQAKLIAADHAQDGYIHALSSPVLRTEKTAAIIGAGPAGMAAAVYLRRNGVPVTVYERRERPYGIVQYVIPSFRISDDAIYRDFQIAEKLGVEFKFNTPENYSLAELQKKHQFVVIASGAWKEGASPVKQGQEKIIDALKFLEDSKKSQCNLAIGKEIAVIGGGDVAMDCARAAKRNKGVEKVTIVYRRTREFMPAQTEEQELALNDGIEMMELLAPESFSDGVLVCEQMQLAGYDASGRRGITGTGKKVELGFDTVIGAVGARVDTELFKTNNIALNEKGFPKLSGANESSLPGVYIAGDCKAGAATVVKAIADGKTAAADILGKLSLSADFSAEPKGPAHVSSAENGTAVGAAAVSSSEITADFSAYYLKKGVIDQRRNDNTDGFRCLSCDTICEICVDVCPNRANIMVEFPAGSAAKADMVSSHQIVHVDRMCNECGNCATFCPHAGKPYKDKFTVFHRAEDFADSENAGFTITAKDTYRIRLEDKSVREYRKGDKDIPVEFAAMIEILTGKYEYLI
ncbi:MAG: putative selenate reductase subunit YgfK [Treponema sp.]|nr:putative selenate reductase subunit YgfK [Treponema sp.]